MADIGLSAFSLFFMQSESFLFHQRRLEQGHGTSNCHTLFGMKKIPTDNLIRLMLDKVSPEALQPCFDQVIEQLRKRDGLKALQRLGGRTLVALDGTEYFCSQKLSCPQCLTRKRSNGKTEHYHAMLAAMIVAPGHNMVLPLDNRFADQLTCITSYESLPPQHVYVYANASLRSRGTVSGEENDRLNHLHSQESSRPQRIACGFLFLYAKNPALLQELSNVRSQPTPTRHPLGSRRSSPGSDHWIALRADLSNHFLCI
jgi:hypothetical protein